MTLITKKVTNCFGTSGALSWKVQYLFNMKLFVTAAVKAAAAEKMYQMWRNSVRA
jgi:hypothetical protein